MTGSRIPTDALCYGDCLDWMQRWDDESVDLIYLDPPFNSSSATYNVLYAQDSLSTRCGVDHELHTIIWGT